MKQMVFAFSAALFCGFFSQVSVAQAVEEKDAVLVTDFIEAFETFAQGSIVESSKKEVNVWIKGLRDRGVDPTYVAQRLAKKANLLESGADRYAQFRRVKVEHAPAPSLTEFDAFPVALHAYRIDVVEDYDDMMNDDIYSYFVVTHDDVMWGKVTSIYKGVDEGQSFFLSSEDRGLFGPAGEKIVPKNHTIVDYGIIESDGDDIAQLHKISDAIVDLALAAISTYNPQAGAAAMQARAETQNLLRLVISLDDDDRLVTDTVRFNPEMMATMLAGSTVHEFGKLHEYEDFWTAYAYRINFRLLR
jgi:hypothetical protein